MCCDLVYYYHFYSLLGLTSVCDGRYSFLTTSFVTYHTQVSTVRNESGHLFNRLFIPSMAHHILRSIHTYIPGII